MLLIFFLNKNLLNYFLYHLLNLHFLLQFFNDFNIYIELTILNIYLFDLYFLKKKFFYL